MAAAQPLSDTFQPNGATALPMSARIARALLPQEPRILNEAAEHELTERFLTPALAELEAFFLALRLGVDDRLRSLQPTKLGKPYPLGQCLEITLAVQEALRRMRHSRLDGAAAAGRDALQRFLDAGGTLRQVWGDLRSRYFQNAFLVGALYVDVSNDTVTPTKPKVEILPFAESGLVPIADYRHFARIAECYWHARVYPNHLLPELAPLIPGIRLTPEGQAQLCDPTEYMLALTQAHAFRPSVDLLGQAPMPPEIFTLLMRKLRELGHETPDTAEEGRRAALQYCALYRERRSHLHPHQRKALLPSVLRINAQLARLGAIAPSLAATALGKTGGQPSALVATPSPDAHEHEAPASSQPSPSVATEEPGAQKTQASANALPPAAAARPLRQTPAASHAAPATAAGGEARPATGLAFIPLEATELAQAIMVAPFAFMEHEGRLVPVALATAQQAGTLPAAARARSAGQCGTHTMAICETLRQHAVLQDWQPEGMTAKGRKLFRVNEQALNALDIQAAMVLRNCGAMATAYMQCVSMLRVR